MYRQKDKRQKDKMTKRQNDPRHRQKREINIVTSGQFRTLAMFSSSSILVMKWRVTIDLFGCF